EVAVEPVLPEAPAADVTAPVPFAPADDLPVAADPVLPEEVETAGGPSVDGKDVAEDEVSEDLPTALASEDVGLVPLSLLEAEADAADIEGASSPSALPGISPPRGELNSLGPPDQTADDVERGEAEPSTDETIESEASEQAQPISPPVGEMPGRVEGGIPDADAPEPSSTDA